MYYLLYAADSSQAKETAHTVEENCCVTYEVASLFSQTNSRRTCDEGTWYGNGNGAQRHPGEARCERVLLFITIIVIMSKADRN